MNHNSERKDDEQRVPAGFLAAWNQEQSRSQNLYPGKDKAQVNEGGGMSGPGRVQMQNCGPKRKPGLPEDHEPG